MNGHPNKEAALLLFIEQLIYEQSTARGVHEMGQNRASIWSRQPLKLNSCTAAATVS